MLLHKGLTHIHSQIKPKLLFGESFTLRNYLSPSGLCHGTEIISVSFSLEHLSDGSDLPSVPWRSKWIHAKLL